MYCKKSSSTKKPKYTKKILYQINIFNEIAINSILLKAYIINILVNF